MVEQTEVVHMNHWPVSAGFAIVVGVILAASTGVTGVGIGVGVGVFLLLNWLLMPKKKKSEPQEGLEE